MNVNLKMRVNIDYDYTSLLTLNLKDEKSNLFRDATNRNGDFCENLKRMLNQASNFYKLSVEDLLKETKEIEISTSIFLDYLRTGMTSKTGIICTKGFRDILTFMGYKESPFEFRLDYPEPYVTRELTKEVSERIDSDGKIVLELNEDEVKKVVNELISENVEAIAVCLLWSVRNNAHETKIGDIIRKNSNLEYSLSHQVYPYLDENWRTLFTSIDASLKGKIKELLSSLDNYIQISGYKGTIKYLDYHGEFNEIENALNNTASMITASPLAIRAAKEYMDSSEDNGVLLVDYKGIDSDMGSIISEHKFDIKNTTIVDVSNINASGEAVATVDEYGLFKLKQKSHDENKAELSGPSVNEANIVLGYLKNENVVNNQKIYRIKEPGQAIEEEVCKKTGETIENAAMSMYLVSCFSIINKIKSIAIAQGLETSKLTIFGGYEAFGLYAGRILDELSASEVVLPALGGIFADNDGKSSGLSRKISKEFMVNSKKYSLEDLKKELEKIYVEANNYLDEKNVDVKYRKYEYMVTVKYPNQTFELAIPFEKMEDQKDFEELVQDFHKKHLQLYYVNSPEEAVEFTTWSLLASGGKGNEADSEVASKQTGYRDVESDERRSIFFEDKYVDVNVYSADRFKSGDSVKGLCMVESELFPILVYPQQRLTMTAGGYLQLKKITNE